MSVTTKIDLPKSLKIKIALTILWVVISVLMAGLIANDGYSGFQFASFFGFTLFFNIPALLYWLGFWIWGDGYLFRLPARIVAPILKNPKLRRFLLADDPLQKHPWRRYWARIVDYTLWSYIVLYFIEKFEIALSENNTALPSLIIFVSWIFVEGMLLASWGTTPGKWLLGMSVRSVEDTKLPFKAALKRSTKVYVVGMGFGIPIITLFTATKARNRLVNEGVTSWDQACGSQVLMQKVRVWGALAILLVLASVPYNLYHRVQIETTLDQFSRQASSYPEKRIELLKNYMDRLQELLGNRLKPENLATEVQIAEARQNVAIAKSLLLDTQNNVNQTIADARRDINALDVPASYRIKMISSYEGSVHNLNQALSNFFQVEKNFLDLFDEILSFLNQRQGQYAVQDGKLLFQSDTDLAQFNSYTKKISEYSEQEADAIKKLQSP